MVEQIPGIDFRTTPFLSYGGNQDAGGSASVGSDGGTVTFTGNTLEGDQSADHDHR